MGLLSLCELRGEAHLVPDSLLVLVNFFSEKLDLLTYHFELEKTVLFLVDLCQFLLRPQLILVLKLFYFPFDDLYLLLVVVFFEGQLLHGLLNDFYLLVLLVLH